MLSSNNVVTQDDADAPSVGKVFGQPQGIGNAAFAFLIGVVEVLQAEFPAVGEQPQEVARIAPARHHQDLTNARIHERLDGVIDHGLVVNRQQVLIGDLGQREHSAARAAGQNDYPSFTRLGMN